MFENICDLAPQNGLKVASQSKANFDIILFLAELALNWYKHVKIPIFKDGNKLDYVCQDLFIYFIFSCIKKYLYLSTSKRDFPLILWCHVTFGLSGVIEHNVLECYKSYASKCLLVSEYWAHLPWAQMSLIHCTSKMPQPLNFKLGRVDNDLPPSLLTNRFLSQIIIAAI